MEKENLYSPEALINLIIEGDLPISRIAKETNIPLPTLKNYIYGKTDASSMQYRMIKDLTDFFRNGQPLEVMLEENDCVMLSGERNLEVKFPHIEDERIHTFKVLSELAYRNEILYENKNATFEPFLVVLTKEMVDYCECGLSGRSLLQKAIKNCESFNLKFVTTASILLADYNMYLKYNWFERHDLQMFVACNDTNGLQKVNNLDKTNNLKKRILPMSTITHTLSEYCYYIMFGNKINTQHISGPISNLDPGYLSEAYVKFSKFNGGSLDEVNNVIFDAVTSKYDFITAVTFSNYDNLFNNKHTYFTESLFSGDTFEDSFSTLDFENNLLENVKVVRVESLVTDIKEPIRPNHFNIKKFIEDKNIDTSSDIFVNVSFRLNNKEIVTREYIHSIEYITLDGEKCVYKF